MARAHSHLDAHKPTFGFFAKKNRNFLANMKKTKKKYCGHVILNADLNLNVNVNVNVSAISCIVSIAYNVRNTHCAIESVN